VALLSDEVAAFSELASEAMMIERARWEARVETIRERRDSVARIARDPLTPSLAALAEEYARAYDRALAILTDDDPCVCGETSSRNCPVHGNQCDCHARYRDDAYSAVRDKALGPLTDDEKGE
jgi:hypothetical protein